MSFTIYPAIDIKDGKGVRLYQGDYKKETAYGDPVVLAKKWEADGAPWLHMVDLNGAKSGEPTHMKLIEHVVKEVNIPIQVGGGIRTIETIKEYLAIGVKRVIIGTAASEDNQLVEKALQLNRKALAVGIDAREGYVATNGWLNTSKVKASDLGKKLADLGVSHFIFTDISKDGTLTGPNVEATKEFALATGATVIASGGVGSLEDLAELTKLEAYGVKGAIVGKAIYTGKIRMKDLREFYF